MLIKFGDMTIGDSPATIPISGLSIAEERSVQVSRLFRANNAKVRGRGNRISTVSFTATRTHATTKEAEVFILEHRDDLIETTDVLTIKASNDEGDITRYMSAAAQSVNLVDQIGRVTIWSYVFMCENALLEAP